MKIDTNVENYSIDGCLTARADVRFADWKEAPEKVLEMVDDLLKDYGLQVVHDGAEGSDTYVFKIERICRADSV